MFGPSFKGATLKANLKMASQRIALIQNKKKNGQQAEKRNIAALLEAGKEEKARLKTEALVHEDFTLEAYEIIDLLCELLAQRMPLIEMEKECPLELKETVCSLIWCAARTEIAELLTVQKQLELKYGKVFADAAKSSEGCVNERLFNKLSIKPPDVVLVINYMKEIAKAMKVDWEPKDMSYLDPPIATGYSIPPVHVYNTNGPQNIPYTTPAAYQPASAVPPIFQPPMPPMFHPPSKVSPHSSLDMPSSYTPPQPPASSASMPPSASLGFDLPSVPTTLTPAPLHPAVVFNPSEVAALGGGGASLDIPDFDELQKRFAELKR